MGNMLNALKKFREVTVDRHNGYADSKTCVIFAALLFSVLALRVALQRGKSR